MKRRIPGEKSDWPPNRKGNPERVDVGLMIRSNDKSARSGNAFPVPQTYTPEQPAQPPDHGPAKIQRPLRQHARVGTRAVPPPLLFDAGAGLNHNRSVEIFKKQA